MIFAARAACAISAVVDVVPDQAADTTLGSVDSLKAQVKDAVRKTYIATHVEEQPSTTVRLADSTDTTAE